MKNERKSAGYENEEQDIWIIQTLVYPNSPIPVDVRDVWVVLEQRGSLKRAVPSFLSSILLFLLPFQFPFLLLLWRPFSHFKGRSLGEDTHLVASVHQQTGLSAVVPEGLQMERLLPPLPLQEQSLDYCV